MRDLHEFGNECAQTNIQNGKPCLAGSDGSNIGGINMKTTNEMLIVYPALFDCLCLVPFSINPIILIQILIQNTMVKQGEPELLSFLSE
ncbi:Type 1 glutamine amidotransferase-like domain-containing protein [Pedobacter sp. MC2016-05]|uniref:Type 1 glutamine amidotransferase-like domain-containing protein n=1 Tax=Pedobacter sp. MC2016-05 TaxID=2994474 RepID=UPI0022485868|nr:Type 1 glutamine amidotransferase-like domain-containing protein [Pedobacter sp. MC2016-05]MCX2476333.1 Type 1 glutamine amidotransferase-like domain-containing protein [Pedobacter sp. MC2016-05]